ncbi:hypothetical protein GQ43DRAFT_267819 [Delitschia confertaspora ATCC 74209]|uniref:Uncharacterized protein n=1 Tax=Delitschia confertaspora ATCC 74209 TaxID=1513339 RepID=A0A9P4JS64_9PLEO|nr:hypothetical protein GQ43DRAFT_267819 [Delitschia confertaspora ATCC 74209]
MWRQVEHPSLWPPRGLVNLVFLPVVLSSALPRDVSSLGQNVLFLHAPLLYMLRAASTDYPSPVLLPNHMSTLPIDHLPGLDPDQGAETTLFSQKRHKNQITSRLYQLTILRLGASLKPLL